ncbi:VCBS repeat-containing protein, partial [Nostoc sp. NIES-2111]
SILLICLLSQAQLKVTSFAPTTGAVGSTVSIAGGPFSTTSKNNIVYFGAVRAQVESAGLTNLIVKVPSGATHHPITVITGGLVAQSRTAFRVSDHFGQAATLIAGSFGEPSYYSNGTNQSFSLLSEDLDTDGKPDIIVTNQAPKSLAILKNTSSVANTSFASALQFEGLTNTTGLATGDLNGDGKKEIVTVNVNNGLASHVSVYPNTSDSNAISFGARFDSSIGNGATG